MTAIPRALFVLALFTLATLPMPLAAADDCVEVSTATFSEGTRIIANAGRQLALGFRTASPGDGLGFVVIITPSVCSGFGLGGLGLEGIDVTKVAQDGQSFLNQPTFLPLP